MKLLAADFTESLRGGEPRIETLRTLGDPDPAAAAAAFSLVLTEPGLSLHPEAWVPALLRSARPARGAEWERQLLIRLRAVTGPPRLAKAFCEGIRPFVYRRSIDPAVLRAVRDMKHRIEKERREARRNIEADLKEGPGGIRDVEFLVQALQLFLGGRTPEIRTGNTLNGLEALVRTHFDALVLRGDP